MTHFTKIFPFCAALALLAPAAVFAQSTTETVVTTTEETDDATVADQLSLGEEAQEAVVVGQPYTRETIGAWEMRCIREESNDETCQMYQLMEDGEGAPVAEVSLFRLPGGGKAVAGATVIVPLETSLNQQLTISIDGGKARRYPFAFCNPVGCYVRLGLVAQDVTAFKRGNKATFTIYPALAPDQKVDLSLSLEGFTASYDKVSVIQQ